MRKRTEMNDYRYQMLVILLITVMTTTILFPASVWANNVRFIYGTGFVPETLQDGDRVQEGTWIEADEETIVVLNHSWSSNDGVCEEWVIIRGKRYQVEPRKTSECKELGQGNELAQAIGGKSMVGRVRFFMFSDGKADSVTPNNLQSLNKDLISLKEKSENTPPSSTELARLEERRRKARQALSEEQARGGLRGIYTIQQKSNGRYLDAHEGINDSAAVTRTRQGNDTQQWILTRLGNNTYTIQQNSNGQYLDAHVNSKDNTVVTRGKQNNDTQRWVLTPLGDRTYRIQQKSTGGYMDAHEGVSDNAAVTRNRQDNDTQQWIIKPVVVKAQALKGTYTIQQKSNGRYMDAHEGSKDNAVVTRDKQNNNTQRWDLVPVGTNIYTIQQKSNGRYMDAHEGSNDNAVVTRNKQNNSTQRWLVTPLGNNTYTVQQRSNGRYLDAHEGSKDNAVVTREKQNNNTQRWIFKR